MNSLATNQEVEEGRTVAPEGWDGAVVPGTHDPDDTCPSGRNITEMHKPDFREVSMSIIVFFGAKISGVYEQGIFFPTSIDVKASRPVPESLDIVRLLDSDQLAEIGSLVAEKIEREANASY